MGWRNPLEVSEFEIQALGFFNLKETYKNVRGEFHFKKDGKQAARFDLVLLNDNNELEVILEIKSKHTDKNMKQLLKYKALTGKPALYIKGEAQAKFICSLVRSYLRKEGLIELDNSLRKIVPES